MATVRFDPQSYSLILDTVIEGKSIVHARMVLDTGATYVLLPWWVANGVGLSIDPKKLVQSTTVSMTESTPFTRIPKISVMGKTAQNVECMIKDLPSDSGVDGLLGLSFLKHFNLSLDFKKGILKME